MKTLRNVSLLLLLALGAACYWYFYLLPQRLPQRRLAPAGTVYLLQYVSAPRPGGGGVIGFAPGTPLRVLANRGPATLLISDGTYEAEVPRSATTDDLDAAEAAGRTDGETQRRLAAERKRVAAEQAAVAVREAEQIRRAQAEIERRRHPPGSPTPTPALAPPGRLNGGR